MSSSLKPSLILEGGVKNVSQHKGEHKERKVMWKKNIQNNYNPTLVFLKLDTLSLDGVWHSAHDKCFWESQAPLPLAEAQMNASWRHLS